jgi:hypothetical protein
VSGGRITRELTSRSNLDDMIINVVNRRLFIIVKTHLTDRTNNDARNKNEGDRSPFWILQVRVPYVTATGTVRPPSRRRTGECTSLVTAVFQKSVPVPQHPPTHRPHEKDSEEEYLWVSKEKCNQTTDIKLQQTADIKIFWFPLSLSRESINEKARNKNRSSLEPIIDPS